MYVCMYVCMYVYIYIYPIKSIHIPNFDASSRMFWTIPILRVAWGSEPGRGASGPALQRNDGGFTIDKERKMRIIMG